MPNLEQLKEPQTNKRCGKCRKSKPLSDFYRRRNRPCGYQGYCKECSNKNRWKNGRFNTQDKDVVYESNRQSYKRNKARTLKSQQQYRLANKQRYAERKIEALELIGPVECSLCAFNHPGVLQFHHRDPTEKLFDISVKLQIVNVDWEIIRAEAEKCDILCSNCHDLEHNYQTWCWWEDAEVNKALGRGEDYLGEKESSKSRKEK